MTAGTTSTTESTAESTTESATESTIESTTESEESTTEEQGYDLDILNLEFWIIKKIGKFPIQGRHPLSPLPELHNNQATDL